MFLWCWTISKATPKTLLKSFLLLNLPLVLATLLLSGVVRCVDVLWNFFIDPMYLLLLDITRTLKYCHWNLPRDSNKRTFPIRTVERNPDKIFRNFCRFTFKESNSLFQHFTVSCSGMLTEARNSFKGSGSHLCGLFTRRSFMGMFGSVYYESLDNIPLFICVFVDERCEFPENDLLTEAFTKYAGLLSLILRSCYWFKMEHNWA